MKLSHATAIAVFAVSVPGLAAAQTATSSSASTDMNVKNGVATQTTTVEQSSQRRTTQPKKVLGVKVGHRTVKHRTVRKTKVSSNGNTSTTVKSN